MNRPCSSQPINIAYASFFLTLLALIADVSSECQYAGKTISIYEKLETILASLPSVKEVVITGHLDLSREPKRLPSAKKGTKFSSWNDIIKVGKSEAGGDLINFRRASAMTVVYILYSSGTTGMDNFGTCVCPAMY